MPPKTKVQLKAEIEQARRELWELCEESEARCYSDMCFPGKCVPPNTFH